MIVLLLFAFISGLVTILAPCIWPLLPIILSSTTTGGRAKPLGITLGIVTSFAFFTLTISYIVKIIPFDPNILRLFAVIVIGFLGFTLAVPRLSQLLEGWVSGFSGKFAGFTKTKDQGFRGGLITGLALGIVWSPCAGPILATIATLAATQSVNFATVLVTLVYVVGVGIPLFFFATLGSHFFNKSRTASKYTETIQRIFGIVMILTALAIFTNYDKVVQVKLLDFFPSYSNFLYKLENNKAVQEQLESLRGKKDMKDESMNKNIIMITPTLGLGDFGRAPEFAGITKWLNLGEDKASLTMAELRGKVVLIDFWTYTCINCIRTLPFVTSWYEKYKDQGFVVVGVHTPEFEFEKNTGNVEGAIRQYKINYPVAQDNDYKTWDAFNNRFWPAKYLIDTDGTIRYTHFGEGEYDITEKNIQTLLREAGKQVEEDMVDLPDQTPKIRLTPETYLGLARLDRYEVYDKYPVKGKNTFYIPESKFTGSIPLNNFFFEGDWNVQDEYSESLTSERVAALELSFYADKIYLVITPKTMRDGIKVYLDEKLVDGNQAGSDVKDGYVQINTDNLDGTYNLIDLRGNPGEHMLRLEFESGGTKVFAFTFG